MKKNKMLMLSTMMILNLLFLMFYGCRPADIKDNKLYVVEENNNKRNGQVEDIIDETKSVDIQLETEGIDPFIKDDIKQDMYKKFYTTIEDMGLKEKNITPLTMAKDGNTIFAMECIPNKLTDFQLWQLSSTNAYFTIKGELQRRVNLLKVDLKKKEVKSIYENIDFISLVKWNEAGNKAAFLSGDHLFVYNLEEEKLFFEDIKEDTTTYFSWSPDGSKIYTEGPNLVNYSIYYIDSEKLVRAYETKEDLYYKGKLDTDYYFATIRETDEIKLKYNNAPLYRTVIVNRDGNIIKELVPGRFRDVYKRSILQVGESEFGLYYYADIENLEDVKVLTEEYVYDAKFVVDGKIAYITQDKDNIEENGFILHIADKEGNEVNRYNISSSKVFVTPDGETGILSAQYYYKIDFEKCKISDIKIAKDNIEEVIPMSEEEKELKGIFQTVRGSMDVYFKYQINKERDYGAIEKYFVNFLELDQVAVSDIKFMFDDTNKDISRKPYRYNISLYLDRDFKIYDDGKRASIKIHGSVSNSFGTGMGTSQALELIKKDDKWYVMGLSTFPDSKRAKYVRNRVLKYIEEMKKGKLFDGSFKNKKIDIIQIQFWRMSEPHLSPDIDSANFSKVYLSIMENGKETIYKMILDNKNYKNWKPTEITNQRLGMFF